MQPIRPFRREIAQANLSFQEAFAGLPPMMLYASVRTRRRGAGTYGYLVDRRRRTEIQYLGPEKNKDVLQWIERTRLGGELLHLQRSNARKVRAAMGIELGTEAQNVLIDMALAGAFEGPIPIVLVGTHAMAAYELLLGHKIPESVLQSQDLDFASDEVMSAAVLRGVHHVDLPALFGKNGFTWIPSRSPVEDGHSYDKWASPTYKIEILAHRRGNSARPVKLPQFGISAAEPLPWLDYVCTKPVRVVMPLRTPVEIAVPEPARFALHKLAISYARRSPLKAKKDRVQAEIVLLALAANDLQDRIEEAYREAPRGKFRVNLNAALHKLPASTRTKLRLDEWLPTSAKP